MAGAAESVAVRQLFSTCWRTLVLWPQDSLDNLIGQNAITWRCINGWYRLAYQIQNSAYVPAVRQLFCVTPNTDFNQSEWQRLFRITRLTHVLWKCFVCPQNVNLPISIWLYSTKIKFFVHFENKIDTGKAFMNGNNNLTLGLYCRLTTGFVPLARSLSPVTTSTADR